MFSAAGSAAARGLLVVVDGGGQGQQQRPRWNLDGGDRLGRALLRAVLVDGQVGITADDRQAEDTGGGS